MSIVFTAASRAAFLPKPVPFFAPPEAAGRRIVCGFTYLQRIGKGASTEVWFPSTLREKVAARVLAGDASVLDEFHVEWAAVRQYELMQEADNYYIFDLKVENFVRAYDDIVKMRAKGYRLTVITMGRYVEPDHYDELRLLDARLQDEITQIINMLYLEEQSLVESKARAGELCAGTWTAVGALPHVATTLGAAAVFGKASKDRQMSLKTNFLRVLDMLPQRHIVHDVALGLALPEASKKKNWVYCAPAEYTYHAFQTALANVFRAADPLSLGALHERPDARGEAMPVMHHMRGYGDHMRRDYGGQTRALAGFFQQPGQPFAV